MCVGEFVSFGIVDYVGGVERVCEIEGVVDDKYVIK